MLHSLQELAKEEFWWFFLWHFLPLSEIDHEQADKKKGREGCMKCTKDCQLGLKWQLLLSYGLAATI